MKRSRESVEMATSWALLFLTSPFPCGSLIAGSSPRVSLDAVRKSAEGKNYGLHLRGCRCLHPPGVRSPWIPESCDSGDSENHAGKKTRSGGSDPTYSAFGRPRSPWGRSRPPTRSVAPVKSGRGDKLGF
jgi:hypothetical protein